MSDDKGVVVCLGIMACSVTEDKEHVICQRIKEL